MFFNWFCSNGHYFDPKLLNSSPSADYTWILATVLITHSSWMFSTHLLHSIICGTSIMSRSLKMFEDAAFQFPKIAERFAVRDGVWSKRFQTLDLSKPDAEASLRLQKHWRICTALISEEQKTRSLSDNWRLFQKIIVAVFQICKHPFETNWKLQVSLQRCHSLFMEIASLEHHQKAVMECSIVSCWYFVTITILCMIFDDTMDRRQSRKSQLSLHL